MSYNIGGQDYDRDGMPVDPRRKANEDVWKNLSSGDYSEAQYGGQPMPAASGTPSKNPYSQNIQAALGGQQAPNLPMQQPMQPVSPSAMAMQGAYGAYQPPKSYVVAALLAFFLGEFGVHNFYLGYTRRATIQLLVFLLGIPLCLLIIGIPMVLGVAAWAFVEFILILMRSGQYGFDADGRPLE